jgi:hypothetical protein
MVADLLTAIIAIDRELAESAIATIACVACDLWHGCRPDPGVAIAHASW